MSAGETTQALTESKVEVNPQDDDFHAVSQSAVYALRWKAVQEALAELDVEAFEAEAVWGPEITERLRPLRRAVSTLGANIQLYLMHLRSPQRKILDAQATRRTHDIMYEVSEDPQTGRVFTSVIQRGMLAGIPLLVLVLGGFGG